MSSNSKNILLPIGVAAMAIVGLATKKYKETKVVYLLVGPDEAGKSKLDKLLGKLYGNKYPKKLGGKPSNYKEWQNEIQIYSNSVIDRLPLGVPPSKLVYIFNACSYSKDEDVLINDEKSQYEKYKEMVKKQLTLIDSYQCNKNIIIIGTDKDKLQKEQMVEDIKQDLQEFFKSKDIDIEPKNFIIESLTKPEAEKNIKSIFEK